MRRKHKVAGIGRLQVRLVLHMVIPKPGRNQFVAGELAADVPHHMRNVRGMRGKQHDIDFSQILFGRDILENRIESGAKVGSIIVTKVVVGGGNKRESNRRSGEDRGSGLRELLDARIWPHGRARDDSPVHSMREAWKILSSRIGAALRFPVDAPRAVHATFAISLASYSGNMMMAG